MDKIQQIKVINDNKISEEDTGSAEVQIAILSSKIEELQKHFRANPKDKHSNKGLVAMVNNRKKHLQYLLKNHLGRYEAIIKKLSLKDKR